LADSPDDPLGRALGDSLWPEYFTAQHIQEKMRSPLLWATQFQQTPLDEAGSWVSYENLKFEDQPGSELKLNYVIAIDLALSVGKGDFTVIIVAGIDSFRRLHVIHVDRKRTNAAESVNRLVELCRIYPPSEVLIDDDNASKVFINYLVEAFRNNTHKGSIPPVNPLPMRGQDKETRAAAIRSLFITDNVRITKANWNNDFIKECLEFPSGDHDDIVDALGLVGRRMRVLSTPQGPRHTSGEDPQKNNMIVDYGDGLKLNMPLNDLFQDRDARMRRRQRL